MATKKSTPRKAPAKKASVSKRKKATRSPEYVSFRRSPEVRPFINFTPTQQTFYWTLIGAAIFLFGLYVISLQMKINEIYDQVDTSGTQVEQNSENIKKPHN